MAAQTRVYRVFVADKVRLVRASHPAAAMRFVAEDLIDVRVATQDDLIEAGERGIKVEIVKHEQQPLPNT